MLSWKSSFIVAAFVISLLGCVVGNSNEIYSPKNANLSRSDLGDFRGQECISLLNATLCSIPAKINSTLNSISTKINSTISGISTKLSSLLSTIPNKINSTLSIIPIKFNSTLSSIPDKLNATLSNLTTTINSTLTSIFSLISAVISFIAGLVSLIPKPSGGGNFFSFLSSIFNKGNGTDPIGSGPCSTADKLLISQIPGIFIGVPLSILGVAGVIAAVAAIVIAIGESGKHITDTIYEETDFANINNNNHKIDQIIPTDDHYGNFQSANYPSVSYSNTWLSQSVTSANKDFMKAYDKYSMISRDSK